MTELEVTKVEGTAGVDLGGLKGLGLKCLVALAVVGLVAIGFVGGRLYDSKGTKIQTFDARLGKCGAYGCQEYMIGVGKETHPGGCACAHCTKHGIRQVPRAYVQLLCPDGHMPLAPARE